MSYFVRKGQRLPLPCLLPFPPSLFCAFDSRTPVLVEERYAAQCGRSLGFRHGRPRVRRLRGSLLDAHLSAKLR